MEQASIHGERCIVEIENQEEAEAQMLLALEKLETARSSLEELQTASEIERISLSNKGALIQIIPDSISLTPLKASFKSVV